jgi:ectoine hydrolase
MREAGKIAERVMQTAIDRLEPGVRECDAVAAVYQAQMSGTPEFGGDYPAIVPMMPTGREDLGPPSDLDRRPVRKRADGQPGVGRLPASLPLPHRPDSLPGKESTRKAGGTGRSHRGRPESHAGRHPSRECGRGSRTGLAEHIAKAGLEKESRIGYAMGLNYPPDWGEHTASLRPGDQTVLEPNMTFHMILGMWMDDYGFECSESFRVRRRDARRLPISRESCSSKGNRQIRRIANTFDLNIRQVFR